MNFPFEPLALKSHIDALSVLGICRRGRNDLHERKCPYRVLNPGPLAHHIGCAIWPGYPRPHSTVGSTFDSRNQRYLVGPHIFISPSADSRRVVVCYWQKYVHEVLVNGSGALSLPRKIVVRLTDGPDMTSDVYHKRKSTPQPKKAWVSAKREESISMKGRARTSYQTWVLWHTI